MKEIREVQLSADKKGLLTSMLDAIVEQNQGDDAELWATTQNSIQNDFLNIIQSLDAIKNYSQTISLKMSNFETQLEELQKKFIMNHKTTFCQLLKNYMDTKENYGLCKEVTK